MSDLVREIAGRRVLLCGAEGPTISGEREAVDLVGEALGQGAEWVVIPAERLDPAFFRLATGLAGAVVQKFVNYGLGLAILGDIRFHLAASRPLADWVRECDRGDQVCFADDFGSFADRMATRLGLRA